MVANWAVFVTTKPSAKALNRALLLIQDFEFTEYPDESLWVLLTSKQLPSKDPGPKFLPVPDINGNNDFAPMSFTEINVNWLVTHQRGLETSTCLVCEQAYYYDPGGGGSVAGLTSEFRACRILYEPAHGMIVNLEISNMGFEEFMDKKAGEQEDRAWKWRSFPPDTNTYLEDMFNEDIKRANALREQRHGGFAN
ncbi:hypothetical protein DFH08DRAFT_976458 [Mycena albidolilacea]|uniref:Uncharacterized protein n=1 Tax=Mycena albidolilacea TaxID=1033008 RepID=A0AAD7E9G0_9AGAR|nr:hypothetical protein DFH08DRAFT_976458 [Mycena albidolilacea]